MRFTKKRKKSQLPREFVLKIQIRSLLLDLIKETSIEKAIGYIQLLESDLQLGDAGVIQQVINSMEKEQQS